MSSSCWVMPATAPGMTTANPFDSFVKTNPRPVLYDRIKHILAACGLKTTMPAHEMSQSRAVRSDHEIDTPGCNRINDSHRYIIMKNDGYPKDLHLFLG